MATTPAIADADAIRLTPASPTHWVCGICGDTSANFTQPGAARAAGDRHAWAQHHRIPPAAIDIARLWDAALHCTHESDEALVRELKAAFGGHLSAANRRAETVMAAAPELRATTVTDLREEFQSSFTRLMSMHVGTFTATKQERAIARILLDDQQRATSDLAAVLLARSLDRQTA